MSSVPMVSVWPGSARTPAIAAEASRAAGPDDRRSRRSDPARLASAADRGGRLLFLFLGLRRSVAGADGVDDRLGAGDPPARICWQAREHGDEHPQRAVEPRPGLRTVG